MITHLLASLQLNGLTSLKKQFILVQENLSSREFLEIKFGSKSSPVQAEQFEPELVQSG